MNTCYKCGRELASGSECEPDCQAVHQPTDEQVQRFIEMMHRQRVEIDWDKVKTLEDLLLVHKTLFHGASVMKDTDSYAILKRFLKSEPDGQS
jgi:hypothetical protein